MVIGLFGASCTGKSTIANEIAKRKSAKIFSGKDYIRLAKSETEARMLFTELLKSNEDTDELIIFVITEKEHLTMLPGKAVRVYVTSALENIKARFAKRINGRLPPPVEDMLDKMYVLFDDEKHDLKIVNDTENIGDICDRIIALVG